MPFDLNYWLWSPYLCIRYHLVEKRSQGSSLLLMGPKLIKIGISLPKKSFSNNIYFSNIVRMSFLRSRNKWNGNANPCLHEPYLLGEDVIRLTILVIYICHPTSLLWCLRNITLAYGLLLSPLCTMVAVGFQPIPFVGFI